MSQCVDEGMSIRYLHIHCPHLLLSCAGSSDEYAGYYKGGVLPALCESRWCTPEGAYLWGGQEANLKTAHQVHVTWQL
jgi:hypothetical protein